MRPTVLASAEVVSLASSLLGEADPRKIKRFVFTEVKYESHRGFSAQQQSFFFGAQQQSSVCFIMINIIFNSYPLPPSPPPPPSLPGPSHRSVVFGFFGLFSPLYFLGRKTTPTKQNKHTHTQKTSKTKERKKTKKLTNGDLGRLNCRLKKLSSGRNTILKIKNKLMPGH